jgi:DNA processing protein
LCRTETIGPVSFYALLRRFGSARAALEMVPQLARRGERSKTVTPVTRTEAEAEFAALQRLGAQLVLLGRADLSERAHGSRRRAARS